MNVLMFFLDGVGIGNANPSENPFFAAKLPALRSIVGGSLPSLLNPFQRGNRGQVLPVDACLGVSGLPQSGTGQTALFTGVNASQIVGKHFGPHPYSSLKPIIIEKNIFRQLIQQDKKVCFANAFPQKFFDYQKKKRSKLTVTTLSCQQSGLRLLDANDLENGRAISADITNIGWKDLGHPGVHPITAETAGQRLGALTRENDFVLFEYWKTDHAGHAMNHAEAVSILEVFDECLGAVLSEVDLEKTLIVLTSDHGNIENLGVKTHTRNPVPLLVAGNRSEDFVTRLRNHAADPDLTHVTPLLVEFLST